MILTRLVLRRPGVAVTLLALLVGLGLLSLATLPRQEDPELPRRGILVTTRLPGATAERIDARVVAPMEDLLEGLAELEKVKTVTRPGLSFSRVILLEDLVDFDAARAKVRARIQRLAGELPPEVIGPFLEESEVETFAFLVALVSDEVPLARLDRLAQRLEDRLRPLPGAGILERFGDPEEVLELLLDDAERGARGLGYEQVASTLARSDVVRATGRVRVGGRELVVEAGREHTEIERVGETPLELGDPSQVLTVRGLGELHRGAQAPVRPTVLVDGAPAVVVGIRMKSGSRVDHFTQRVRPVLEGFRDELPAGSRLEILMDQGRFTQRRLAELARTLAQSTILVVIVTALFLGVLPGLLVASVLPLVSLLVLSGFSLLGVHLQQISICSLVLSMGLVIDAAIVVSEHLHVRLARAADPSAAAIEGVGELWVPLLMSTLTTICAFLPIVLLPGDTGNFVWSLGIGVILALSFSWLTAMTYTPAISVLFRRLLGRRSEGGRTHPEWYVGSLRMALRHPGPTAALCLAILLPCFLTLGGIDRDFFPSSDRNQLVGDVWLEGGSTREETLRVCRDLDAWLRTDPAVTRVTTFVGRSAPNFYYNLIGGERDTPEYAQLMIQLADDADPDAIAATRTARLPARFDPAQVILRALMQGPPARAPVEVRIQGPDPRVRRVLAGRVERVMSDSGLFRARRWNVGQDRLRTRVVLDPARLRHLELTPEDVSRALGSRLEGTPAGDLREGEHVLPILVRGAGRGGITPGEIMATLLPGGTPLASVGHLEVEVEYGGLARFHGMPALTVGAWPRAGVRATRAVAEVSPAVKALSLPAGYRVEFGGQEENRLRSEGNLFARLYVAVMGILLCLVIEFDRAWLVALVGLTVPLCLGPALAALWLTGFPLGFTAILGCLALTGVVLNDAILLVDGFEAARSRGEGLEERVERVTLERTNHVFLTSLTTVAGFLPLVLAFDEFWSPLATAVIGGLSFVTLVTLFLVPALYLIGERVGAPQAASASSSQPTGAAIR